MSSIKLIDQKMFRDAFLAGAYNLSNNKEIINELNVFPVPDGDTGTNMTLTIMSAAEEVKKLSSPSIDDLGKAIASGSLRGARGNSGVILSQLFRGFCKDIKGKKDISALDLASAFSRAVDTAYKAVMKPKEGTILTVAKGMAQKAFELVEVEDDVLIFLEEVVKFGDKVLAKTPDLLPVLKEAGVVDSGGQGLMEFMHGVLTSLKGGSVELKDAPAEKIEYPGLDIKNMRGSSREDISTADIKFTYCTEFICNLREPISDAEKEKFRDYLLSIGDSLVFVSDDEIIKIHVHTNHPGQAFEAALERGFLTNMKIDNMKEEHSERVLLEMEKVKNASFDMKKEEEKPAEPEGERKDFGFIAVASGEGLSDILKSSGVDYVISGGQTMNPSTDDFINAANTINADTVYILPNNKNIILAANQAAGLIKDKKLMVIPTTTIPQGISAMLAFSFDADSDANFEAMSDAINDVRSGSVTYAVRDTSIDGKEIKKDDIMGLSDKGIESVGNDISRVTVELIKAMADDDAELVTIYYGEDVGRDAAEKLVSYIEELDLGVDIELADGGQPIYYYLVSVE